MGEATFPPPFVLRALSACFVVPATHCLVPCVVLLNFVFLCCYLFFTIKRGDFSNIDCVHVHE